MKLRVNDDFKKVAKSMLAYFATAIVVFPIYHLRKGDFCWSDTFLNAAINLAICVVIGSFFFFGMQVPEKKDE